MQLILENVKVNRITGIIFSKEVRFKRISVKRSFSEKNVNF